MRQYFPQTFFLSIYLDATRGAVLKFRTGEKTKLADNSINSVIQVCLIDWSDLKLDLSFEIGSNNDLQG